MDDLDDLLGDLAADKDLRASQADDEPAPAPRSHGVSFTENTVERSPSNRTVDRRLISMRLQGDDVDSLLAGLRGSLTGDQYATASDDPPLPSSSKAQYAEVQSPQRAQPQTATYSTSSFNASPQKIDYEEVQPSRSSYSPTPSYAQASPPPQKAQYGYAANPQPAQAQYGSARPGQPQMASLVAKPQPQQITYENLGDVGGTKMGAGWGSINKHDDVGSAFSNVFEPPKAETLVEDPRAHQINAPVKKLIQTIQNPSLPPAHIVQVLKTIPNLARSEANLRSMKHANIVSILLQLMRSSLDEKVVEYTGKAVESILSFSPEDVAQEMVTGQGLGVLVRKSDSSEAGVQLQSLKILTKVIKAAKDKAAVGTQAIPTLISLLSSQFDTVKAQSTISLYYLFEDGRNHRTFTENNGAPHLLKLLTETPSLQVWSLGAIARLANDQSSYQALEYAGLEDQLNGVLSGRSSLLGNCLSILLSPGDKKSQLKRVEAEIKTVIAKMDV